MADIPAISDAAGLPNLDNISVWLGLVAPKGTPESRSSTSSTPRWSRSWPIRPSRRRSERTGNYPVTSTPEQFSAFIQKEATRWSKVIKETGIKFD